MADAARKLEPPPGALQSPAPSARFYADALPPRPVAPPKPPPTVADFPNLVWTSQELFRAILVAAGIGLIVGTLWR